MTPGTCPHERPVGHPRPRHKASRVACASLVYMLSPIPRRGGWDPRFCSCSPSHVSLPRKRGRVGPRIVLFEACSAFTRVTACTLATSPYIVTRWSPEASTASLPPQLLRLLPAGAFRRVGLSPTGKRRLSTAHPETGHSSTFRRPTVGPISAARLGPYHLAARHSRVSHLLGATAPMGCILHPHQHDNQELVGFSSDREGVVCCEIG